MSVATAKAPAVGQASVGVWPIAQSAAVVSVGLYALALTVRLWATSLIELPAERGQRLLRQRCRRISPPAAVW